MEKTVIVIGAGAAGLMAAAAAAEKGHRVIVLEKNEKAGKKIYITGKGRCNLTNDCDTEEFFSHVVRNPKFLYSAVYGFDHGMVKDFFEKNGCAVKVERGSRVFPVSDHASDVTAALVRFLKKHDVDICCHSPVEDILTEDLFPEGGSGTEAGDGKHNDPRSRKKGPDLCVRGVRLKSGKTILADAVILCTGGLSYPSTGSTGDGLKIARRLGLKITPTAPSLVPFETRDQWCRDLQGLALKNVSVRIFPLEKTSETEGGEAPQGRKKAKPVYEAFGELLFTHFGLSGPIILTASCSCDFEKYPEGFRLFLDLKPALSQQQLEERIAREFAASPGKHLPAAIRPLFPARLAETVTELSGFGSEQRAAAFSPSRIRELASLIKNIPVTVTGTRGYTEAIITRGGISVKEINPSTMETKKIAGLYIAGEILDVDAHTGGFNLQIAWSTGHLAGSSIPVES